jgi:hypothetical protein
MKIEVQGKVIEVSQIEFRGVEYNIPAQQAHVHVILVDKAGSGAYSMYFPFRYDGDWPDDEIRLFALNALEDIDLDKTSDKLFTGSSEEIPDVVDVSTKSWWEYLLFWR